jgi:hypothetical protein
VGINQGNVRRGQEIAVLAYRCIGRGTPRQQAGRDLRRALERHRRIARERTHIVHQFAESLLLGIRAHRRHCCSLCGVECLQTHREYKRK